MAQQAGLTIMQLRQLASGVAQISHPLPVVNSYPVVEIYDAQPQSIPVDPRSVAITRGDTWQAPASLVHIHDYWHRYVAITIGVLIFFTALFIDNISPNSLPGDMKMHAGLGLFAGTIGGLQVWGFLAWFRGKIRDASNIHTLKEKSPIFKIGAGLGLAFYLYSNGLPELSLPSEFTRQTLRPIVWGGILFVGEIYGGGKVLEFIARRFFGYDPSKDAEAHSNLLHKPI